MAAVLVVLLAASPTQAQSSPQQLAQIADASVAAARDAQGLRTAFAFGKGIVITIAGTSNELHLITASGASDIVNSSAKAGSLVALDTHSVPLRPLVPDTANVRTGAIAYVLGTPLGYQTRQLRRFVLPALAARSRRRLAIPGQLPRSFLGAPVVTQAGRLIGVVADTNVHNWTLVPRAQLQVLAATATGSGGGGLSTLAILGGVLLVIVIVGCSAVLLAGRRRRRAFGATTSHQQDRTPPETSAESTDSFQHLTQPLVRLRTPTANGSTDDFDVVLRPQEDE
jgi:hypothetical protein